MPGPMICKKFVTLFGLLTLMNLIAGCSKVDEQNPSPATSPDGEETDNPSPTDEPTGPDTEEPEPITEPLPEPSPSPTPPEVALANGWDKFELLKTNRADTKVDSFGHFVTSWNSCTRVQHDGVIANVEVWNNIVTSINAAILLPPLKREEMQCMAPPALLPGRHFPVGMDGDLVVILANREKRPIFESRYRDETCTTIPNKDLANTLLINLNTAAAQIASEGCPTVGRASPTP